MKTDNKKKVVFILPIIREGMDRLREKYEVIVTEDDSRETVLKSVEDADAVVTRLVVIDKEVIDRGKKLKAIAKFGTGVDNIDVEYAKKRGISIVTSGDANARTVAEHVMTAILSLAKNVKLFDRAIQEDDWYRRDKVMNTDVYLKKLGIIGYGSIGKLVAKMARDGFGMEVMVYARPSHEKEIIEEGLTYVSDINDLLKESDYVSVHVSKNKDTIDLINRDNIGLMKKSAYLINYARGGIVNEEDLKEALDKGLILGAAVDVFEHEPPGPDYPLLNMDNVLLSPHIAFNTYESKVRMAMAVADGIEKALR